MVISVNDVSTEGVVNRAITPGSLGEIPAGAAMVPWQQYGTSTAIANSNTETSIFNTSKISAGVSGYTYVPASTLWTSPANFLSLGTGVTGQFYGSIANTGTPTLRVRVVLRTYGTNAIAYTIADTGAVAMTTVSASDFQIDFSSSVAAIGTSGSILGRCGFRYGGTIVTAAFSTTTVDTTQPYLWDVLLTWGAASSSNTMTLAFGQIGLQ